MSMLDGAVSMHQKAIKRLIDGSSLSLIIRLPMPVTGTSVNPFFGDLTRERNKTGQEMGPYNCLWYDAFSVRSSAPAGGSIESVIEKAAGQYREADSFAQLWLPDLLVDANDQAGQLWLDRALDVLFQNRRYKVIGYTRTGLATVTPYIATVALRGGLGYDD